MEKPVKRKDSMISMQSSTIGFFKRRSIESTGSIGKNQTYAFVNRNLRPPDEDGNPEKRSKLKTRLSIILNDIKKVDSEVDELVQKKKMDVEESEKQFKHSTYQEHLEKYGKFDSEKKQRYFIMSTTNKQKNKQDAFKNMKKQMNETVKNSSQKKIIKKSFYLSFDQKLQQQRNKEKERKYYTFLINTFKQQFNNYSQNSPYHLKGLYNSFSCLINNLENLCQAIQTTLENNRNFDVTTTFIIKLLQNEEFDYCQSIFQSFFYYFMGKITQKQQLYEQSIRFIKKSKNQMKIYSSKESSVLKLFCYNNLGFNFKKIQLYKLSKHYYQKYLQFAWILELKDQELDAYDKIGLAYMYLNQISNSKYFHERKIVNDTEPLNSNYRTLSRKRLQIITLSNQQVNYQIVEKPTSDDKKKAIYFVEEVFNNYSSDESIKIDIPDKEQFSLFRTIIDKYDNVNQSHHTMQTDYVNFSKRNKTIANNNIRLLKYDVFLDQKQEPITFENQNYLCKIFKSHQSQISHIKDHYLKKTMGANDSKQKNRIISINNTKDGNQINNEKQKQQLSQAQISKLKKFQNNFQLLKIGLSIIIREIDEILTQKKL